MYFDINLKLLSGKNTQKVNKKIFGIRKIVCLMSQYFIRFEIEISVDTKVQFKNSLGGQEPEH